MRSLGLSKRQAGSGAAKDQEFRDGAKAIGSLAKNGEFIDGAGRKVVRDFVRTLQAVDCGISGFLLRDIFARGFAERGGRFFDIEDVVGHLKRPADVFAETLRSARRLRFRARRRRVRPPLRKRESARPFSSGECIRAFSCRRLSFGFEIGNLTSDHAVDRPGGCGDLGQHRDAPFRIDGASADDFKREREQRIAGKNRGSFAEFFVARRLAAAKIIVVERGKIVVDQRIRVDEFDRARRMQRER